ncbi:fimbrial biogenesis chaperone [Burkholderia sp. RF2-non_BP3]|uniref:fimbrial biogenesis chaperone n=1 Tax=Burkholderia sp. RF2-non_BP3 TaxID=1637844 RepID=UPI000A9F7B20|nr:molecular chaperone [Burkholderia sp. RF2-non_BP3]
MKLRNPYKKAFSMMVFGTLAILTLMLPLTEASASVVLSATRIVFEAKDKEATIQLVNEGKQPSLVQAWIDDGDMRASVDEIDVPFVVTPTVFRVEPGKGQALRIIYSGEPLPADKESLFWLNVLDVPPKAAATEDRNVLQVAFRSRIKLMYRPAGLSGDSSEAPKALRWSLVRDDKQQIVLKAENPTSYVVNLGSVTLNVRGKPFTAGIGHILPGEAATFPVKGLGARDVGDATVTYSSVDDWGSGRAHEAAVAH